MPSRAQAQKFDGKEESLNHDNYSFDETKNELICDNMRYKYRGIYTRKNGKKIVSFYNSEIKKKMLYNLSCLYKLSSNPCVSNASMADIDIIKTAITDREEELKQKFKQEIKLI